MKLVNRSNFIISVSVSKWSDTEGSDNDLWFNINPGNDGVWTRLDPRGHIMAVELNGETTSYFVLPGSSISIYDDHVEDNNRLIRPAGERY